MNAWLVLRRISAVTTVAIFLSACGSAAVQSPSMVPSTAPASASPAAPSSASSYASPSESTASPSASQAPSQSLSPAPAPSTWTGLVWSDPVVPSSSDAVRIDDIVAWRGEYVAVGMTCPSNDSTERGAFFTSTDGVRWTVVQTVGLRGDQHLTRVMAVGDRLLAIGEIWSVDCPVGSPCPSPDFSPDLWMSPDGSHWSPVDSPTWHAAWRTGYPRWVVAGDGGIVAVGYEGQVREWGQPLPPAVPLVFHSTDGATWEKADLTHGFDHAVFRDAVAYGGSFVIVGRDGEPDRLSEVVDPLNPVPLGVGRPAAWLSSDGIHWTVATVAGLEIAGGELSVVEAGADGLFAIGAGSPSAGDATPSGWSSADGATWHVVGRLGTDLPAIDQAPLPGSTVLASDGWHIVVLDRQAPGSDAMAAWASTDGATWVRLSFAGSTSLPKIGYYGAQGAQGMYVTGAAVLPDRIVVSGRDGATSALWLATAVSP
jgi:hypothetical protein